MNEKNCKETLQIMKRNKIFSKRKFVQKRKKKYLKIIRGLKRSKKKFFGLTSKKNESKRNY